MKTLLLVVLLGASGDPQYFLDAGPNTLTAGQANQVGTFVSTTWPGNPLASVQEVECWVDSCRITVVADFTAAEAWTRYQAGWKFKRVDVTKNALDDYTIRMESPPADEPATIASWIDGVFGAGTGDKYLRLRIYRDSAEPTTVLATLKTRETQTILDYFEDWLAGTVGEVIGVEP